MHHPYPPSTWGALPVHPYVIFPPVSVSLWVPVFLFLQGHQSYWLGAHSNDRILTGVPLQRPSLQIQSHSEGLGLGCNESFCRGRGETQFGPLADVVLETRRSSEWPQGSSVSMGGSVLTPGNHERC